MSHVEEKVTEEEAHLEGCEELYEEGVICDAEELEDKPNSYVVPDFALAFVEAKAGVAHFYENRFEKAFEICSKYEKGSLPHSHGQALLRFISALLTLEPPEIEKARKCIEDDINLCYIRKRQNSVTQSLSNLLWRPIYDDYKDEEVHAELNHAEALCMSALLTFFGDQSIMQLFKGAYQLTIANQTFKTCLDILNHKQKWEHEVHQREFECGVRTGIGLFNLIISHLPAKVMKLLTFAGFYGDKKIGLDELKKAIQAKDSIRYEYCAAVVMGYNLYIENIFGAGEGDLDWAKNLAEELLHAHPQSIFFKFFYARTQQVIGDHEAAIQIFKECTELPSDWEKVYNICYWDMCWSYALNRDWVNASKCAHLLSKQCKWSPATNMYQYAVFLHHQMEEENNSDLEQEIDSALKQVPVLKIRYAGKTIPPEKFATESALKYINHGEKLVIPAFELFYVWNVFANARGSSAILTPILEQINLKVEQIKGDKDDAEKKLDNYCKVHLLKGVCLKYLSCHEEALECFMEVMENESRVSPGSYIPPHAALELGLTYMKLQDYSKAKHWLDKATGDYSGYLIEALVHLRAHNSLKKMTERTQM